MSIKLAVIGSRTFSNVRLLHNTLDPLKSKISQLVSGGAQGADSLAQAYAAENKIQIVVYKPDLKKYPYKKFKGKAYAIRNRKIVSYCDEMIAFWDGKSRGTKMTIKMAQKAGKKCTIIRF